MSGINTTMIQGSDSVNRLISLTMEGYNGK